MGDKCQLKTCPEDCNDQGRCKNGRCICFEGYSGMSCGIKTCANNCHNHGQCQDGVCICDPGFADEDCSSRVCPRNCLNRGRCENGLCICYPGYAGVDCGSASCPNNCNERGDCEDGVCVCDTGFTGPDCGSRSCLHDCNDNGKCIDGVCICNPGYSGEDCGYQGCPEDCNEQGQCISGTCVCDAGFVGPDCGTRICSPECERRGRCEDGECICNPGFTGPDCEIRTCPNDCHNQGRCDDGKCICDSGYTGPDCGIKACPNKCNNRGRCQNGICMCNPGFTGPDCGSKACPKNCSGNGQCINGKCICNPGFIGPVCGTRSCPADCSNHGRCVRGTCVCSPGYTGVDCSVRTCPNNCHNQGGCEGGVCFCEPGFNDYGFTGQDCGSRTCPNDCYDRGHCKNGFCVCDAGYKGEDCGIRTCPKECHQRGRYCSSRTCPNNCYDRGKCEDGQCICEGGYSGQDCAVKTCPKNCNDHGTCDDGKCCVNGKCVCDAGFTGPVCGARTCPENCRGRGKCVNGVCTCKKGYTGPDCSMEVVDMVAVTGLQVISQEESTITLEWDQPQAAPDSYEISFKTKKENGVISTTIEGSLITYHQTGLAPGEEYIINIQPRKGSTLGPETSITANTKIEAPRGLRVTDTTQSSLFIRWEKPQILPDRYIVTLTQPNGKEKKMRIPGKMDRAKVSGLEADTEYRMTLRAEKEQEQSQDAETTGVTEGETEEDVHRTTSTHSKVRFPGGGRLPETSSVAKKLREIELLKKETASKSNIDGKPTPFYPEGPSGPSRTEDNLPKFPPSSHLDHLDILKSEMTPEKPTESHIETEQKGTDEGTTLVDDPSDPTKSKKQITTLIKINRIVNTTRRKVIVGNEDKVYHNETVVTESRATVRNPGGKVKNQTKLLGPHMKSVIENLPEKLSSYNGTFIQRLESYLRATSYPLRGNQTVESIAKAIFLYLIKWKPDSFTGMVYDRLPQKTPGATGYSEPIGASHLQGSFGNSVVDSKEQNLGSSTDPTKEGIVSLGRPDSSETVSVIPNVKTLGRVEAVGEIDVPDTLPVGNYGSSSEVTDGNVDVPDKANYETMDVIDSDISKQVPSKLVLDKSKVSQKTPPKKPTIPQKKNEKKEDKKRPISETTKVDKSFNKDELETPSSRPKMPEYEAGTITLGRPTKKPKEKPSISSDPQGSLLNVDHTIDTSSTKKGKDEREHLGPIVDEHNNQDKSLVVNQIPDAGESQGKADPLQSPTIAKVPGPGAQGRPSVHQRTPTSLVISLEGLGFLWDRVIIIYSSWPPIDGVTPQKMEVERGVRQVEIKDLSPGTSYRFDLHGLLRGRSSKSYSLVTDTAPLPTTVSPTQLPIEETTPPPIEETTPPPTTTTTVASTVPPRFPLGGLQVRDVTTDTVTLVWKAKPNVFESFLVRYEDVSDGATPKETSVPGHQREVTLSDLTGNTRYAVSVYGIRGGKLSRPLKEEVTTDAAPGEEIPTPPRLSPISVSDVRTDSFRLTWEPLDGDFDAFVIQYGPPGGPFKEETLRGDETTMVVTGLQANVNYTVEIRGVWGDSYSKPETAHVFTEKPQPPRLESISPSDIHSDSVHLTWEVKGSNFDSFLLSYRDGEGRLQEIPLEGDVRSYDVKELKAGKKYKFILHGITEGKKTKPVTTEIITEKSVPPRLESLSVSDILSDSLRLSWEVNGGEFESFLLLYRDAEAKPKEVILDGDQRMLSVEDLKPGKKYKFILYGITGGKRSKAVTLETTTVPRKVVPTAASTIVTRLIDFKSSDITKDSVTLSWLVEGKVPFDWIVLQYREPEGGMRELQIPGQDSSTIVHGLLPSQKYEFTVYGLKGNIRSESLTTEVQTGYPETVGPPVVTDLYISPHGPHAIHLSWEAPEGSFHSFLIRYKVQGQDGPLNTVTADGTDRNLLLSGLQPDTIYTVTLHGIRDGNEQSSMQNTGKTAPLDLEAPKNLQFSNIQEKSAIVAWDPPNSETTTFKVSYEPADGGEPESVSVVGSSTTLKRLIPGTKYEVTVVSVRGFEESSPLTGYFTTTGGGPRSLRAHDVTEESALLRWEAPTGPVDQYLITYRAENIPLITVPVPGDRTELPLSGLHPHTQYFVSVQSTHGSATSASSSTSFTTSADTPRDLKATQITPRTAMLTWKAPDVVPDAYLLTYQTPQGEVKEIHLGFSLTSFLLSQLDPSTQYRVQLHTLRHGAASAPISTSFTTGRIRYPNPRDCWEQRMNGEVQNGAFTIYLGGNRQEQLTVYCDMETDGGGWIVFQRRMDGSTDFYRNWTDYKNGFGNMTSEFWLGNIALHQITSSAPYELRVDLRAGDESAYAVYDDFRVEGEAQQFRLRLGKYRGTAGDSMDYHNNMVFSTRDRDTQRRILPCAMSYRGAWWYRNCHYANLNGLYGNNRDHQGVNWKTWKGFEFSIPFTEMKMRPRGMGNWRRL
uniref:Tenascin n=1 Tax=Pyxicephalus adspersus TaxID=30357 RepID=A0AAV3A1D4_PYXAD|nr:TPA: hypothetical protein GDO54_017272 [Pyxicephalus adspersus]